MEKVVSKNLMSGKNYYVEKTTRHLCEAFVMWGDEFLTETKSLKEEIYLLIFPDTDNYIRFCSGEITEKYEEMERIIGVMNKDPFEGDFDDLNFYIGQTVSSFEMALEFLQKTADYLLCNEGDLEEVEEKAIKDSLKTAWDEMEDFIILD